MNNRRIRTISIMLALMLAMIFVSSCSERTKSSDTTAGSTTSDSTTAPEEETPIIDYKGANFTILISGNSSATINDFKYDESSVNKIDNAVYKRNLAVEQKYNINIVTIEDVGIGNTGGIKIKNAVSAGDSDFDAAVLSAYDAPILAYQSFLYDLNTIPYLGQMSI